MRLDVVFLPRDLQSVHLQGRAVVVFDVLRATTSICAALNAGVKEIRVFPDTAAARNGRAGFQGPALLCGEEHCLPPPGFDLGNSPGVFNPAQHSGRTLFMSTTNGTRAIYAARGAARMFAGALVNCSAVAEAAIDTGFDVTLLCSGTEGAVSIEDVLGAGAVLSAMRQRQEITGESDKVLIAERLFSACRGDLLPVLEKSLGGQHIIAAHLHDDIAFAAQLDVLNTVGEISGEPPVIRPRTREFPNPRRGGNRE